MPHFARVGLLKYKNVVVLCFKVARTKNPWHTLKVSYGNNKGKAFTEEEDRFLVCMMQTIGYGNWDQLKIEIRKWVKGRAVSPLVLFFFLFFPAASFYSVFFFTAELGNFVLIGT